MTAGQALRTLVSRGTLIVPGVYNALVGRMAQRLGFQALYLSGAATSASLALPDVGLITLSEMAEEARRLADAVEIPVLCDADTGFGEAVNVERAVRVLEKAGVAGIHLEDQELPKRCGHLSGKKLVPVTAMVSKIRAALAARRDPSFLIIARTDARGVEGLDGAIARARAYVEAGADGVFPEALESLEEFATFARAVPTLLVANMTEFGRSPALDLTTLAGLGYGIVLYPLSALRVALAATRQALQELLLSGHTRALVPHMMTRQELYDLLDYTGYEERDRFYFTGKVAGPATAQRSEKQPDEQQGR
ncbi:MAG: methylisocitrate lyase [Gemmataceae bacterium]